MLDIRRIRAEPDAVKAALGRRGHDTSAIDEVLALDREQRTVGEQRDHVRSDRPPAQGRMRPDFRGDCQHGGESKRSDDVERQAGFDGALVTHGLQAGEAPEVASFLRDVVAS